MTITLPTKSDLLVVYGAENIDKWASANNDGSPTAKETRIAWAVNNAYNYVCGRLASQYNVAGFVTLPYVVFELIAKRGGIELYESPRGLVDGDPATRMLQQKSTQIEARIDQILSGQLQLLDLPSAQQPIAIPHVDNSTARFRLDPLQDYGRRFEQFDGIPCVGPNSGFYEG